MTLFIILAATLPALVLALALCRAAGESDDYIERVAAELRERNR